MRGLRDPTLNARPKGRYEIWSPRADRRALSVAKHARALLRMAVILFFEALFGCRFSSGLCSSFLGIESIGTQSCLIRLGFPEMLSARAVQRVATAVPCKPGRLGLVLEEIKSLCLPTEKPSAALVCAPPC